MQRVAFRMKLFKGCEAEYKKRHNEIWPELKDLLKQAGIKDYSIFLDEETNTLFGYLTITNISRIPQYLSMRDSGIVCFWHNSSSDS